MEKNTIKKVVLSAASAVVFASLSIGTTFALFTSTAKTEVQVSSGKINVAASVLDPKTYSAVADSQGELVDENGAHYRHDQQGTEEVQGVTRYLFSNTGYVTFSDTQRVINIDRITPGDKLVFSYDTTSDSNVSYKYRFSYKVVNDTSYESYLDLVKGLKTTIQKVGATDPIISTTGLVVYQSDWDIKTPTDELDNLQFTIELPMDVGNAYQNKSAKLAITFEAIQANAYTEDVEETTIIQPDVKSAETSVDTSTEKTSVNAGEVTVGQQTKAAFTVQVPHTDGQEATTYEVEDETNPVTLSNNDKIVVEVSDLGTTEEVYSTETSLNFDLTLKINDKEANNFSAPITVSVYVGEGKIISAVMHNNQEVTDFTYENGYISFSTTSFSPFSVDYINGTEVYNYLELTAALADEDVYRIGIKSSFTIEGILEVTKDQEIFGVGENITLTGGSAATRMLWIDKSNVTLNLANLNFVGGSNTERGLQVNGGMTNVTMNCKDVKVTGISYYGINICSNTSVYLNFERCEVEAWGAVNIWSDGYTANFVGCKLTGINDKTYNADGWNDFGVVVLEGDTTGATETHATNNCVTLVNTELVAKTTTGNKMYYVLFNAEDANNTVVFKNVTLTDQAENGDIELVLSEVGSNSLTGTYTRGGQSYTK